MNEDDMVSVTHIEEDRKTVYSLTLSDEELWFLQDQLCHLRDKTTDDDTAEKALDLLKHLSKVENMLPSTEILYVCVYDITQEYGGPEEGGWYYNPECCIQVIPIRTNYVDMKPVLDLFLKTVDEYLDLREGELDNYVDLLDILSKHRGLTAYEINKYGEGMKVTVEQHFGGDHDTARKYYE